MHSSSYSQDMEDYTYHTRKGSTYGGDSLVGGTAIMVGRQAGRQVHSLCSCSQHEVLAAWQQGPCQTPARRWRSHPQRRARRSCSPSGIGSARRLAWSTSCGLTGVVAGLLRAPWSVPSWAVRKQGSGRLLASPPMTKPGGGHEQWVEGGAQIVGPRPPSVSAPP